MAFEWLLVDSGFFPVSAVWASRKQKALAHSETWIQAEISPLQMWHKGNKEPSMCNENYMSRTQWPPSPPEELNRVTLWLWGKGHNFKSLLNRRKSCLSGDVSSQQKTMRLLLRRRFTNKCRQTITKGILCSREPRTETLDFISPLTNKQFLKRISDVRLIPNSLSTKYTSVQDL